MARTYTNTPEPRFVEKALNSQSTDSVKANPTLVGDEADLLGLEVDGVKYQVASEGTSIKSTSVGESNVLMSDGDGGAAWQSDMTDEEVDDIFAVHKGDLIEMNLDGTKRQYLVMGKKITNNGHTYQKVLGRFSLGSMAYSDGTTEAFADGWTGLQYKNSTVYNACATWYSSLSETAQGAIYSDLIDQKYWYANNSGNPDYIGKSNYSSSYTISYGAARSGADLFTQVPVAVLSVQDVIDYLEVTSDMTFTNTTLTSGNLLNLIGVSDPLPSSGIYWFKDALRSSYYIPQAAAIIITMSGMFINVGGGSYTDNGEVYPSFYIDLSQVNYKEAAE